MLTFKFLQESSTTMDISWLVWVALAIFFLMVLLGWWASGRLPIEDDAVSTASHGAGHDEDIVKD
jgi:Ca2+/Na+ antiporter